jgi:thiol-disulfide isomerase/thioredoxin
MVRGARIAIAARLALWTLLACCFGAVAAFAGEADRPEESRCSVVEPGSFALENFQAVDLSGRRWTREALSGRPALIVFWATWCPRCIEETAVLREIRSEHGDRVQVIGVNLDGGERPPVAAFLQRHRVDWPQIHEGRGMNGNLARLFKVRHLPFAVLIGPDGRVISTAASVDRLRALMEEKWSLR